MDAVFYSNKNDELTSRLMFLLAGRPTCDEFSSHVPLKDEEFSESETDFSWSSSLEESDEDEDPVLWLAVNALDVELVYALIEGKASIGETGSDGTTPLYLATQQSSWSIIQILLTNGANPNIVGAEGDSPLLVAAQRDDVRTVRMLLQAQADIDATLLDSGYTALLLAVENGFPDVVMSLLEYKACVNYHDSADAMTALHLAAKHNRVQCMEMLLDASANLELLNDSKKTPLMLAVFNDHEKCTTMLLQARDALDPEKFCGGSDTVFWDDETLESLESKLNAAEKNRTQLEAKATSNFTYDHGIITMMIELNDVPLTDTERLSEYTEPVNKKIDGHDERLGMPKKRSVYFDARYNRAQNAPTEWDPDNDDNNDNDLF